jgi:DNA-binding response OmpR family regulator
MKEKKAKKEKIKKVLIVEDDRYTNELISETLRVGGFDVYSVFDGEAGVSYARKNYPDLIVLDLLLPGIDGWEVCRLLRQEESETRKIPIIIASVISRYDVQQTDMSMGALSFFNKPFEPNHLVAEVQRILSGI